MLGEKFKQNVRDAFASLLESHLAEMKEAYLKSEGGLTISVPIRIQPSKEKSGFIEVTVGMRFVRLRTKGSVFFEISEAQDPLFKAVEKLRPKKGSGIDSVKLTHEPSGESVELRAEK